MEWIVLVHVLSATIGLGPAFAFPVMLRKEETVVEAIRMTDLVNRLEMFPKVFGTLAVVTGLLLFWLGSFGPLLSI